MLHTFITSTAFFRNLIIVGVLITFSTMLYGEDKSDIKLVAPMKKLFSHKSHSKSFKSYNLSCVDCHHFSVKPKIKGPLAPSVKKQYLKPHKDTCHKCHLRKLSLPRSEQCTLCHLNTNNLQPKDHHINWKRRHGKMAQFDRDSCTQCHKQNDCSECHLQRDNMKGRVHPGNFRFTHSIKARTRPESCYNCHQSPTFCKQCHMRK